MRTVARLAAVVLLALAVLGADYPSGRPAHFPASRLGPGRYPAYPAIAADGSLGFDAVWAGGTIMTAHWSATTRKWGETAALSPEGVGQSTALVAASPSGAAAVI